MTVNFVIRVNKGLDYYLGDVLAWLFNTRTQADSFSGVKSTTVYLLGDIDNFSQSLDNLKKNGLFDRL